MPGQPLKALTARIPDMAAEERWPASAFTAEAQELREDSWLLVELCPQGEDLGVLEASSSATCSDSSSIRRPRRFE
jgi:hypothetical protein